MPGHAIPITTLGELIDGVTPTEPDAETGRRRDVGVYRGNSRDDRLLTSLDRLGGRDRPHSKGRLESHILRNFIRYARPHLRGETIDDWEHLVAAQHHGAPTRLLDWTYSPLVAAFFATRPIDGNERSRVIWRLDWRALHRRFGFPLLSLQTDDLSHLMGGEGYTPWNLFDGAAIDRPFACLVEPPSLDARIVAQAAVFTLSSDRSRPLDEFLAEHDLGDALTRVTIEAEHVPRIRDQLDLVGVDERRLFPDLDGVAETIRRYYS